METHLDLVDGCGGSKEGAHGRSRSRHIAKFTYVSLFEQTWKFPCKRRHSRFSAVAAVYYLVYKHVFSSFYCLCIHKQFEWYPPHFHLCERRLMENRIVWVKVFYFCHLCRGSEQQCHCRPRKFKWRKYISHFSQLNLCFGWSFRSKQRITH